ncbi:MAG TPA: DUF1707 domain-containing protein [Streptosporangiaceae bacterium]
MSGRDDSMRVSDAERDTTLTVLGFHAAAGRLTRDELEERCGQALTARTRRELATITRDLPEDAEPPPSAAESPARARGPIRRTVAIMGGTQRRGPFRAAGSLTAIAVMGGDDIDLREADIEGAELTVKVFSILGEVHIYVADTVGVELAGLSIAGANRERGAHRRRANHTPLIRVRAFNLLGTTTVYRVPPQAHMLGLAEARHFATAAEHHQLPAPASAMRSHPHRKRRHRHH